MPSQAAESPTERTDMPNACSCCKSILTGHRHILDKEAYPNNVTFEKMLESNPRQNQYVVCAKCLKKLSNQMLYNVHHVTIHTQKVNCCCINMMLIACPLVLMVTC